VLLCTTATTAEVSSQARNGYQRLNFMFEKPTRLTVENGTGRIVLRFSTPLKKSPAEIAAMTGGYASKATLSADGKTLTLITAQRFRTRHFVSGNMVGLDIIGGENAPIVTAKVEKEKPVEELLTTKKQTPKPIEKKAEKPKKETEKKLKKSEAKPAKKAELAPKPAEEKKPEPVTEPATEEMLTTKETAPCVQGSGRSTRTKNRRASACHRSRRTCGYGNSSTCSFCHRRGNAAAHNSRNSRRSCASRTV
jgi:hypothetical protein